MANLINGDTEYPTSKDSVTEISDGETAIAAHFNGPAKAVVAIENELGVGLKGSLADLATRLNINMSTYGGLLYGSAFPTSPSDTPHFYWRTDLEKLYVYDTTLATYSEVATSYSLADYLSKTNGSTITAVHQFNPSVAGSPFTLGANATGQLITGLNADEIDGKHSGVASGLATLDSNTRLYEAANTVWDGAAARSASSTISANTIPVRDSNGFLHQYYKSNPQTITSAGSLTLAHGITGITYPELVDVRVYLKCATTEYNYSVNDIVSVPVTGTIWNGSTTESIGVSLVIDSTNLNIRFANQGSTGMWRIPNKTTGANCAITNANWEVIFVAKY